MSNEELKKLFFCSGWCKASHLTYDGLFSITFKDTKKDTLFLCAECLDAFCIENVNGEFLVDFCCCG